MIEKNQSLVLMGLAYLRNVKLQEDSMLIQLERMETGDKKFSFNEMTQIECSVSDAVAKEIAAYINLLNAGKLVVVQFKAAYQGISAVHTGLTTEDPAQLVIVKAELIDIKCCYANDFLPNHRAKSMH